MARTITVYESGDMLTVTQAAELLGYSREYFAAMLNMNDKAADLKLIRLKVETTPEWRKAYNSRARYVFEYDALKAWYKARQRRPEVKAKAWNRSKSPSPVL
jgi:hypothetical protein